MLQFACSNCQHRFEDIPFDFSVVLDVAVDECDTVDVDEGPYLQVDSHCEIHDSDLDVRSDSSFTNWTQSERIPLGPAESTVTTCTFLTRQSEKEV